jgi:NAD(P)-dependent dehydrogenase (short-subunit alcohol dehydrogenase family)
VSAAARLEVRIAEAPPAAPSPASALAGSHFAITDDGRGVALALADRLETHGATARIVVAGDPWWAAVAEGGDPLDGVVDLSALGTEDGTSVERSFPALRAAIVRQARWVVGVSAAGGRFGRPLPGTGSSDAGRAVGLPPGAGLAGLCRTLALEAPDAVVRAVDVDPKVEPDRLAADIVDELLDSTGPTVVGYVDGVRHALEVVPVPLPAADLDAVSSALALDGTSVTVLFGGARGITASVARALVATTGTRLVLAGRTDPDVPEPPALVGVADDPVALRSALVAAGHRDTAEIERLVQATMAGRQVRAALADLAGLGADVRYLTADVADAAAVRGVLDRVAAEVGRIDLVVHGAGRLEDKLVVDKTPASFARVFRPKVVGALAMAEWLADQAAADAPASGRRPTLVVFGSVSGVFGNRGQADYAAANDALDTLAWVLHGRPDIRVLAVDWGPWGGGVGMVTPELEQLYRRRGIGLLDPAEAVAHLLRELAFGTDTAQVLVADADAAAMAGPP